MLKKHQKAKRASQLGKSKPNAASIASEAHDVQISDKAKNLPPNLQSCGQNMTPACIKALYKIPDASKANKQNSLGLYEQGDYFAKADLDLFYKQYAPWVPQGTYPIPALIDGANFSVPPSSSLNAGESDIDIDLA